MKNNSFIQELKWRGMLHEVTPHTEKNFENERTSGYIGFDPTADSLHIGNLAAIMMLKHLQLHDHRPIILIGGFTGMIGDPSGKSKERNFIDIATVEANINSLKLQFEKFLDFDCGQLSAKIVNNNDWIDKMKISDFMRNVGKFININYMVAKESVKSRLENGISYTEFSYQLFQAYDFYWLYKNMDCKLQMGGSDQWGNITSGNHLIRKQLKEEGFVITCPLITKSDGTKFGKTEKGNIWLDKKRTSVFDFYQFWLNIDDKDLNMLFKVFTLYSEIELNQMFKEYSDNPKELKKILAIYMTSVVHSENVCNNVVLLSDLIFSNSSIESIDDIDDDIWFDLISDFPIIKISNHDYNNMFSYNLFSIVYDISQSEVKRLIRGGGIRVNNIKISSEDNLILSHKLIKRQYLFLKKGKNFKLIKVE